MNKKTEKKEKVETIISRIAGITKDLQKSSVLKIFY